MHAVDNTMRTVDAQVALERTSATLDFAYSLRYPRHWTRLAGLSAPGRLGCEKSKVTMRADNALEEFRGRSVSDGENKIVWRQDSPRMIALWLISVEKSQKIGHR